MKLIALTILAMSSTIRAQESAASPGQIAYAISQNYDQTGPGEGTQQQTTPQSTYSQQSLSNLQQTRPQVFTEQQYQQPQQYQQQYTQQQYQPQQYQQQQYVQPQQYTLQQYSKPQYVQQYTQPMTLQIPQSLFARYQASHAQPQVSYTNVQLSPAPLQQAQPAYVQYTQPQVKYTQQYIPQTKAAPQYQYDANTLSQEANKGRQNEAIFGLNHYSQTNTHAGGFTPITVSKPQEQAYAPVAKATYASPVVLKAVYQTPVKAAVASPLAKFSLPIHYGFSQ